MYSLRTRITLLTVCVSAVAVSVVTLLSVLFIRISERRESEQLLLLLCETGERNLDFYFNSVQKSVDKVAAFVEEDLDGLDERRLGEHVDRARAYFNAVSGKTNGVLTYYYRIDPAVSDTVKGFWYTALDGGDFTEHEVTDITRYDTEDTSELVWFTVPKHTGEAIWLPPYVTDNLDVRVISYNTPIYWRGRFVGVVGIELDYSVMAGQVESIRLYDNGYAFLSDAAGRLLFHPRIDVTRLTGEAMPKTPDGLLGGGAVLEYTFEGVRKQAVWLPLSNGMRLNVTVPVAETEGDWQQLIREILAASLLVLLSLSAFTMCYTGRITRPLERLTEAAEAVNRGNYELALEYDENDEIGRLTRTFRRLAKHVENRIGELNSRAYVDTLTSAGNRGAFSAAIERLQARLDAGKPETAFAIAVFDCDDLKVINDRHGHDKGDAYLKTACGLIRQVFRRSPVFRIGGDEFAVILQNGDYDERAALVSRFVASAEAVCASAANPWEEVRAALGVAVYDRWLDVHVSDTVRRADKLMYADKRRRKEQAREAAPQDGTVSG